MKITTCVAITILSLQMTGLGLTSASFCNASFGQKSKQTTDRKPIKKIQEMIGKTVDLCGKAEDAKAGAVLMTKEGYVIYLLNMAQWPGEVVEKAVCVKGKLRRMKYLPDPQQSIDGALSQGAEGKQYVIEGGKWRRVE